jgi:hypothetical protein
MAKCPKCTERKGKRFCPALASEICSLCCGSLRIREIDCPADCPHLGSGQRYQDDKRMRKGVQRGREYLASRHRAFPDRDDFAFALAVEARLYLYLRDRGRGGVEVVRRGLATLRDSLGPVVLPSRPAGLPDRLRRDLEQHPEFHPFRRFSDERRRRVLAQLVRMIPGRSDDGGYYEALRAYFEEILPPERTWESVPGEANEPGDRRSEGGIILP